MFFSVKIYYMDQKTLTEKSHLNTIKQEEKDGTVNNNENFNGSAYDPDDDITFEWAGRAEGMSFD